MEVFFRQTEAHQDDGQTQKLVENGNDRDRSPSAGECRRHTVYFFISFSGSLDGRVVKWSNIRRSFVK
ncbi:Uncharacterised protein [Mycobacteroides abscessus subsp. abscessus]|nr:Uncharacterised protein [Mycobacteroides abscessus subsp. abscessus]